MRGLCACALLALLITPALSSLSRKKRHLVFPEGSNFVMTMVLTRKLPFKYPENWRGLVECEVAFKLPNSTRQLMKKRPRPAFYYPHRRERRQLYAHLETLLAMQGIDGRACVMRAICETARLARTVGVTLLTDIFHLIFTIPGGGEDGELTEYEKATASSNCDIWTAGCAFSLHDFQMARE